LKTYKNRKFLKKQIFKDRTFDKLMFEESISIIGSSVYLEHDLEQIYDQENRKNISNIDCKEEKQEENSKVRVFGTVLNDSIINWLNDDDHSKANFLKTSLNCLYFLNFPLLFLLKVYDKDLF